MLIGIRAFQGLQGRLRAYGFAESVGVILGVIGFMGCVKLRPDKFWVTLVMSLKCAPLLWKLVGITDKTVDKEGPRFFL